ncbi:MAG: hypothetical protein ACI95C_000694 [Pseudohongiellaceae bacterium]|jgi:hypothetical protein
MSFLARLARLRLTLNREDSKVLRLVYFVTGLFPLTLQGCITLLVTALALSIYGYGAMDLIVFSLAICGLAILLFCLFCSIISGIIIQRRVQQTLAGRASKAILVEAGYPNETGFTLPPFNFFPLVKLSWKVAYPDAIETRVRTGPDNELSEEIIPNRRFYTDKLIREFEVADVLGFSRYSWRQEQLIKARALPKTDSVRSLPLLPSMTAEDGIPNPSGDPEGDRMEIRPYAPGDSIRHIMWKVYARNRQLNVRLAEKSVFHSKRTVAYLLGSPNDEAAAAIARVAIESKALGEDWAFAADGSETPCSSIADALDAIAKSRSLGKPYSYGLDNFLQQAVGRTGAHCILFAAAEAAPWNDQLGKTISRFPGQFSLILATDGFKPETKARAWQKLLLRSSLATEQNALSMSDLRLLLTKIGQLVESTIVIDRKSGQSFDKSLRRV